MPQKTMAVHDALFSYFEGEGGQNERQVPHDCVPIRHGVRRSRSHVWLTPVSLRHPELV